MATVIGPVLIPHVTVNATGDGTFDYFSFTVPSAGTVGIFDIDFGFGDAGSIDTEIAIWTSSGTPLAENDDFSTTAGAGGSTSAFDAFIQFVFPTAGVHIVGVAEFSFSTVAVQGGWGANSNVPDTGDADTL